ncbi:MAG TPA: thermonuclease family protein [bacterium]|nr:thermonuclease family protein [bacterium]
MRRQIVQILVGIGISLCGMAAALALSENVRLHKAVEALSATADQQVVQGRVMGTNTVSVGDEGYESAWVEQVAGGDTLVLGDGRVVKYLGITVPENCYRQEALLKNISLVEGRQVLLETDADDQDEQGRLLRYVWLDDMLVNEVMVREGYAYAEPFGHSIRYERVINQAESLARTQKVGLWGACSVE